MIGGIALILLALALCCHRAHLQQVPSLPFAGEWQMSGVVQSAASAMTDLQHQSRYVANRLERKRQLLNRTGNGPDVPVRHGVTDPAEDAPRSPITDLQRQLSERQHVMNELEQRSQALEGTDDASDVRQQMEEIRHVEEQLEQARWELANGGPSNGLVASDSGWRMNSVMLEFPPPYVAA